MKRFEAVILSLLLTVDCWSLINKNRLEMRRSLYRVVIKVYYRYAFVFNSFAILKQKQFIYSFQNFENYKFTIGTTTRVAFYTRTNQNVFFIVSVPDVFTKYLL